MAGWAGFTDEDLRKIKQSSSPAGDTGQRSGSLSPKQAMLKKQKLQQQQQRDLLARQRAQEFSQSDGPPLPASQRLAPANPPEVGQNADSKARATEVATLSECKQEKNCAATGDVNQKGDGENQQADAAQDAQNGPDVREVKELDEKEAINLELSRVEQFRLQQKKMEEENKQRRKLLADAIKQRSRMAQAEAEKLTKVQKELSHLDSLVTADVAIIRDRIEAASIEFLQAQKRYERAEKEFVEAKMALAEKSELKESLTEHLYTIIQQNEIRKAQRLATLMKELGLEAEDCPSSPSIPPLLSFSPINTLHRPGVSPTSPNAPSNVSAPSLNSVNSANSGTVQGENSSSSETSKISSEKADVSQSIVSQTVSSKDTNIVSSSEHKELAANTVSSLHSGDDQNSSRDQVSSDSHETSSLQNSNSQMAAGASDGSMTQNTSALNHDNKNSPNAADGAVENTQSEISRSSSVNQESQDGGADVK